MVPSLKDTPIHGHLFFHMVPQLPTRSALLTSRLLESDAVSGIIKESRFIKVRFKEIAF